MQSIKSTLLATREQLAPVLSESAFLERGVLTPAEFERAGDRLVSSFPSWSWGRAEPGAERAAHDPEKQYLILRRVPCHARVAEHLQSVDGGEAGAEAGEGWALPRAAGSAASGEDGLADFSSREAAPAQPQAAAVAPAEADDGDEYEDLSAFVGKSLTIRADAAAAAPAPATAPLAAVPAGLGGVVKTRAYDVSISYDRFYQTPRLWLRGFDSAGAPLSSDAMLEDVFQDYKQRTATIEPHPFLPSLGPHISVHPCKHAAVMKSIVDALGSAAAVDDYLLFFLKLGGSMVPTLQYDQTSAVTTS